MTRYKTLTPSKAGNIYGLFRPSRLGTIKTGGKGDEPVKIIRANRKERRRLARQKA